MDQKRNAEASPTAADGGARDGVAAQQQSPDMTTKVYTPESLPGMLESTRVQRQLNQELGESALLALGTPLNKWEVPPDDAEEDLEE